MGTFVLGILVGWLAEWLFFTFWVNDKSKGNSADCSDHIEQLRAKNKEIETLKTAASVNATAVTKAASTPAPVAATVKKTTVKKTAVKKASTKKPTVKKATTKKPVAKKSAPKKKMEKKVAKKPTQTKKASAAKKIAGDDLTKLSGIGPSMSATMAELGITTYKKLASMDDDILRDMLEVSGARLNNNKEAMDSWNEQATLAHKGDFAGLKKLQEELKG